MKKFSIKYWVIFLIVWIMFSAWLAFTVDIKGTYLFLTIGSVPTSYFTENNLYALFFGGLVQWGLVGLLLDKGIPQIRFSIQNNTLEYFVKLLFILGVLGLLLSAMVITNGFASSVIYNVSAGIIMASIGFKIIFLDR